MTTGCEDDVCDGYQEKLSYETQIFLHNHSHGR